MPMGAGGPGGPGGPGGHGGPHGGPHGYGAGMGPAMGMMGAMATFKAFNTGTGTNNGEFSDGEEKPVKKKLTRKEKIKEWLLDLYGSLD